MEYGIKPHPVGSASQPVMRMISNAELDERAEAEKRQNAPVIQSLASYLNKLQQDAKDNKREVELEILEDYRQRKGEYSPQKLAEIKEFGGSEIYMQLTNNKCRAVEAWLRDILMPAGDKPWSLSPTPIAELSPGVVMQVQQKVFAEAYMAAQATGVQPTADMMQARFAELQETVKDVLQEQAKDAAAAMETKIEDQLAEAKWERVFGDFLNDFSTTKAGIIKGPIIQRKKSLKWEQGADGYKPVVSEELSIVFERVSPLDIYPGPDTVDVDDGYLFHRHNMSLETLIAMRGMAGVDESALDAVIAQYGVSGHREPDYVDQERSTIEQRPYAHWPGMSSTIEAWEFWGAIPGKLLAEWGMDGIDEGEVYHCNAWKIGNWIIKATLNEHPLGKKPYSKASLEPVAGAFWGNGPAYILRDVQQMVNACARAISNNMGIASGPQVVVNDVGRLPGTEDVTKMYPWKVWQFESDSMNGSFRPPVSFFQPNPMVDALLGVFQFFSRLADTYIGVPTYPMNEMDPKGAGKTASGMSMALGQAAKGGKRAVGEIDDNILMNVIEMVFVYNMLYDQDESIKGDLKVIARGSAAMVVKEQQMIRRQEFLGATGNPIDMQIIGMDGRATLLRETAKALDMPLDDLNLDDKSIETIRKMVQGMQAQAQQPPPQELDAAGNPVAGQDAALFNQPEVA